MDTSDSSMSDGDGAPLAMEVDEGNSAQVQTTATDNPQAEESSRPQSVGISGTQNEQSAKDSGTKWEDYKRFYKLPDPIAVIEKLGNNQLLADECLIEVDYENYMKEADLKLFEDEDRSKGMPDLPRSTGRCKKKKPSCRLGCVCRSLKRGKPEKSKHCELVECMFECVCPPKPEKEKKVVTPTDRETVIASVESEDCPAKLDYALALPESVVQEEAMMPDLTPELPVNSTVSETVEYILNETTDSVVEKGAVPSPKVKRTKKKRKKSSNAKASNKNHASGGDDKNGRFKRLLSCPSPDIVSMMQNSFLNYSWTP